MNRFYDRFEGRNYRVQQNRADYFREGQPRGYARFGVPRERHREYHPHWYGLGSYSVDSLAHGLGTDRKTLLLIGIVGLVGGYLLNSAAGAAGRGIRRGRRRLGKAATPRNLAVLATVGIAGGAAYLYYQKHKHAGA
jgi:hypothetical protein